MIKHRYLINYTIYHEEDSNDNKFEIINMNDFEFNEYLNKLSHRLCVKIKSVIPLID